MSVPDDAATRSFFKASIAVTVGNGESTLFWSERWLNGQGIKELAPDLLAVVPTRHHKSRTVRSALADNA
jgi:hypothetical protein